MRERRWGRGEGLTVIAEPHTKVANGVIAPGGVTSSSAPKKSFTTLPPSPARMTSGARTIALRRLVYHESNSALPLTTFRLCLMTTEWRAVIMELVTPKPIPTRDTGVPSRKTPTKKPSVTTAHAIRIRRDGRECRMKKDVQTVKGRTIPRAT